VFFPKYPDPSTIGGPHSLLILKGRSFNFALPEVREMAKFTASSKGIDGFNVPKTMPGRQKMNNKNNDGGNRAIW